MPKLAGEPARLTYDTTADVVEGDVIETGTGRRYLVRSSRRVRRRYGSTWHDGQLVHRYALDTEVLPADHQLDDDDVVHPLVWWRR